MYRLLYSLDQDERGSTQCMFNFDKFIADDAILSKDVIQNNTTL